MTNDHPGTGAPYVLVVDDEWMNREMLEAYLKTAGYRVGTANSGEKALELTFAEPPDLIMLDVRMPAMDGYETCQRLKNDARTQLIPVLMLTGLHEDEDRQRALEAGADGFVTKPLDRAKMLAQIESLLQQGLTG